MTASTSTATRGIVYMLAAVALLSTSDAATKWLAPHYSAAQIVFVRAVLGVLPASLFALLEDGKQGLIPRRLHLHVLRTGLMLAALGLFILAIPHIRSRSPSAEKNYSLNQLTWKMALLIGLVQCLAMWPGLSRSMVTISCGVIFGLNLMAAVEYSFLLGMLTLTGATVYEMASSGFAIADDYSWLYLTVGFFSATFSISVPPG